MVWCGSKNGYQNNTCLKEIGLHAPNMITILKSIVNIFVEWKGAKIGENRRLVTHEPVELDKYPVEVQDCMRITNHFKGIYRIYPNLIKENQKLSTCNWLDLQTLGFQPLMPKNLPDHWEGEIDDHLMSTRMFTLIMNKMFV